MSRPTTSRLSIAFPAILVAAAFSELFSADRVPLYGDLVFFVLPMKRFLADEMQKGELALWNPWTYMGTPFLAGLQTGVFYPPSALLLLPFPLGFNGFILAHYFVALIGTWSFLRDRELSGTASSVGSLTFVLGGYLISMLPQTNHLQAAAWAPWVLTFWARHCDRRRRLDLALVIVSLALQLLAGSAETMLMTIGVATAWAAWRSLREPRELLRLETLLAGSLGLALLICAVQILPTAEYIGESDRSGGLSFEEISAWSLEPISLLQLVLPRIAPAGHAAGTAFPIGFESSTPWVQSFYLGIIPLCLASTALLAGGRRLFWGLIVALGFLVSFGDRTPLLRSLYDLAPSVVGSFRYPQKAYFLVHLGAAVLAAEGCEDLLRRRRRALSIALLATGVLIAFASIVLWRGWDLPTAALATQAAYLSKRLGAIAAIFFATLVLHHRGLLAPRTFEGLLMIVVAIDLGSAGRSLYSIGSWTELNAAPFVVAPADLGSRHERVFHYQTSSAAFPGERAAPIGGLQELDRVSAASDDPRPLWLDTWRILFSSIGMVYGVGNVSGGDGIGRRSNAIFLKYLSNVSREDAIRALGIYSVGWLIGMTPLESNELEPVSPLPPSRYHVYRVTNAFPEARLVSTIEAAASEREALRRLLDRGFPAERIALVDRLPSDWSNPAGVEALDGAARIVSYRSSEVVVDVETARRAFLVLNDSYFPGWTAAIDGAPVEILRTNAFVRGVPVEGGHHRVEFRYRPASFTRGAWLSLAGVLGLLGLFADAVRR